MSYPFLKIVFSLKASDNLWSLTVKRSLACLSTQGGRGSRSATTIIDLKFPIINYSHQNAKGNFHNRRHAYRIFRYLVCPQLVHTSTYFSTSKFPIYQFCVSAEYALNNVANQLPISSLFAFCSLLEYGPDSLGNPLFVSKVMLKMFST